MSNNKYESMSNEQLQAEAEQRLWWPFNAQPNAGCISVGVHIPDYTISPMIKQHTIDCLIALDKQ